MGITPDNVNESVNLLRGKAGSEVDLSILHEGATVPVDMKLKRETIRVASVRVRALDPGYVYIRVVRSVKIPDGIAQQLGKIKSWRRCAVLPWDLRSKSVGCSLQRWRSAMISSTAASS